MDVLKSLFVWITCAVILIITFPVIFLVWLIVLPFDSNRRIMHRMMICLSLIMIFLFPLWEIDIRGREKFRKGQRYVMISNHQSILDILFITCLRFRFKWVSKAENLKTPFIGLYLRMARYVTVDRGNRESKEEMMGQCYMWLKRGISVMMFPEGTRSVDGEIGFFKRGSFELAIGTKTPVLPVLIDGSGGVLPKHGIIFNTGHKIRIRVFDAVNPESFDTDDPDVLSLKFHNFMADALKELRSEK